MLKKTLRSKKRRKQAFQQEALVSEERKRISIVQTQVAKILELKKDK